jgi:hypothetical protein
MSDSGYAVEVSKLCCVFCYRVWLREENGFCRRDEVIHSLKEGGKLCSGKLSDGGLSRIGLGCFSLCLNCDYVLFFLSADVFE